MTPPSTKLRVPRDARWDCRSCAACCKFFDLGPVEPEIIRGLEESDIAATWSPAAEGPWYEIRRAPDGREGAFLVHRNGQCVFLQDDGLCHIHAQLGPEAKPSFCRTYPFHLVRDPAGLVLVTRSDCGGLHESFDDGTDLADHAADVVKIPNLRVTRFQPETVELWPGLNVALETWMAWEPRILDAIGARGDTPAADVASIRDTLYELSGQRPAEPEPGRSRAALAAVVQALHQAAYRGLQHAPPGFPEDRLAFLRDNAARIAHAAQRAALPLPPLDTDSTRWLRGILRSHLLSKEFQTRGGVFAGLGTHLFEIDLARIAATPYTALSPEQLAATYTPFKRFAIFGPVQRVLHMARPALIDLVVHAHTDAPGDNRVSGG